MNIHYIHIDYCEGFEDQESVTRKAVFRLASRAIQVSRNSFIYFNEFNYEYYLDDLYGDIRSAIEEVMERDSYNQFYISNLSKKDLEYQFIHIENEYKYILSKKK